MLLIRTYFTIRISLMNIFGNFLRGYDYNSLRCFDNDIFEGGYRTRLRMSLPFCNPVADSIKTAKNDTTKRTIFNATLLSLYYRILYTIWLSSYRYKCRLFCFTEIFCYNINMYGYY